MSKKIRNTRWLCKFYLSEQLLRIRQQEINFWYQTYLLKDKEPAVLNRIWLSRKIRESERAIAIINVELKKRGDFIPI